ncbi:hypothetical protein LSH36_104g02050 [Paralvinella palmiformis]|uniref:Uncharacterized protein n=1 Tax=Paralvinella palmiformis TaxID=53620 RepID=A0AAD9NB39_9ANNE|nr:hypothetical protein LSH36_104g02050 [Paralvinella palmiformis]
MELFVYLTLFVKMFSWALFMAFNYFYTVILRGLYWRFTGVHQQLRDCNKPENYTTSAHVKRILFRYPIEVYVRDPESQFLTVHEGFINPERVLQDDCSLFTFTSTEAIFVQVKNKPNDVFLCDFLLLGQHYSADKLITLPINHCNKLAEEMEDEQAKIIFLYNQARCGGSLVTSLFKETGRCLCFNEPPCLVAMCRALEDRVAAYIIKPIAVDTITIEIAHEVFPDAIQFFLYRDPIEVTVSIRRVTQVISQLKLLAYLPNIPNAVATILSLMGMHNIEYRGWTCASHPEFEFGYRGTCFTVYYYLEALKHGINIHGLRYEDLIAQEMRFAKKIFQLCQLPDCFLEKAMQAFKKDSQGNSPISREKLRDAMPNPPKLPSGFLEVARAMSEEFGVPGPDAYLDKTFRLPNSLE